MAWTAGASDRSDNAPLRFVKYLRVSTDRSAASDLSLPDQRNALDVFGGSQNMTAAGEYLEAESAWVDSDRPTFARMIADSKIKPRPFDVILVLNFSRFARDVAVQEFAIKELEKAGVRVIAVQQSFGLGPEAVLMRQIVGSFNQFQSAATSKAVARTMTENAKQGWWNGGVPPLGYRTVVVEVKGARTKKILEIDPAEAEIVRKAFAVYLHGDDTGASCGVKRTCAYLNDNGYRTRRGARFGIGPMHAMLTNENYVGRFTYNKNGAERHADDPDRGPVVIEIPPIIDRADFDAVQATLKSRNPKVTPPRVTTGETLLTGLLRCEACGAPLIMSTGTSATKGKRYTYYSCSKVHREGISACAGQRISMPTADCLVTDAIIEKVLTYDHVREVVVLLEGRRKLGAAQVDGRLSALRNEQSAAQAALQRLLALVAKGLIAADDPTLAQDLATYTSKRDVATAAITKLGGAAIATVTVTDSMIAGFTIKVAESLRNGPIGFKRQFMRAVVDEIVVSDDAIKIQGRNDMIEKAVLAGGNPPTAVRGFVRKWRTRQESNL